MNKEFIPYKQALSLKELGFDEPCFKFFDLNNELEIFETNMFDEDKINSKLPNMNDFLYDDELPEFYFCTAPLYQQAFRWFREKYQLDSSIALVANGYGFYIHKNKNYTNKGESYGMYITYEEAELACLIKLIEIVKEK